jgi:hypothetical protein
MTTLTVPARPEEGASPRPLPWRRMAWVTWRQHRVALAGAAGLLGVLAVYLWVAGLRAHHAYAVAAACHPASSFACGTLMSNFNAAYGSTTELIAALLQAVPPLIGAFAGAPVLARELETGTFRYAWTLGFAACCSPGTAGRSSPTAARRSSLPPCSTCAASRSPPGRWPTSRSAPWPAC